MIHYHEIEQTSPEWFELRKGKLTGSHATEIGANGAGLKTYCKKIVLGLIRTNEPEPYTNRELDRGNELEPIGLTSYEFENNVKVDTVGFITNDEFLNCGVSPDGLVGEDGGIEIKARNDEKHLSLILGETKEIPKNQIQMFLLISGRKWCDFVSINPNFEKHLFVKRIYPDEYYFEKLIIGIKRGNELIKEYLENYKKF